MILPHAAAFNAEAAGDLLAPVATALGAPPGEGLFALAGRIGAPRSLRELGLAEADLDRAVALATESPYRNPRPVEPAALRALLARAWAGEAPAA